MDEYFIHILINFLFFFKIALTTILFTFSQLPEIYVTLLVILSALYNVKYYKLIVEVVKP
jgi:hypothetical protein